MYRLGALIALTLAWPLIQLAVFLIRFGQLPPNGLSEALVFLPMGLVAAVVAVWLWSRAATQRQKRSIVYGYLIASPIAFFGSLLGGLVLPGIWGPLLFGAVPLIIGSWLGYLLGRRSGVTTSGLHTPGPNS
ncbi:MAG: hypothetical protein AB2L09_06945 [Coriobacteriia bacterium]